MAGVKFLMSGNIINHKALLKSVLIAAVASTLVMALFSGYGRTISPDGLATHYYNFGSVVMWAPILLMIMAPTIAVIAYCLGYLLIKLHLFSLPMVALTGAVGGGLVISALSGKWLMLSVVGAYYVLAGSVSAVICYFLYRKFNKAMHATSA